MRVVIFLHSGVRGARVALDSEHQLLYRDVQLALAVDGGSSPLFFSFRRARARPSTRDKKFPPRDDMYGPEIIVRSMSAQRIESQFGNVWQYNPWSDNHSKITCWAILFDLLIRCPLLRQHAASDKIGFGINHVLTDFVSGRPKSLDIVISIPRSEADGDPISFASLAEHYGVVLTPQERHELDMLPPLYRRPVGDVLMALEAKAAMTAHSKAGPRLFDELTSAWRCINGSAPQAVAVGVGMVNASPDFLSPKRNQFPLSGHPPVWSQEKQPQSVQKSQNRVRTVKIREHTNDAGYDAKAVITVVARNDGSPITLAPVPPALPPSDPLHYERMILRVAGLYDGRFAAR